MRTWPDDHNFNETSPYLDLTPLYGTSEKDTELIRVKDGYGMLSPDCYFEDNLFLTRASGALLILLNRNHNVHSFPSTFLNVSHSLQGNCCPPISQR